ncbi:Protein GstA [Seminavis robusta]|uniref:Protein GstA n=1 Tax=Seminavis robusta TaxID=568900 RepID=A0A9N8HX24_9STRA|nr:Protein GstA [Seminavis robusta]|eukprot:Sro2365_g325030.1 Protein GstA (211) ;mRNA; r:7626-8258
MMKLYAMPRSGNCYKVAWMLRLLKVPHQIVTTSILDGSTKSPAFMDKNPNGQVPLLELEDGRFLAESGAMLLYLAETQKSFLPPTDDPFQRAKVFEWMFFEQYSHEPSIAVRRANVIFQRPCDDAKMKQLLDKGHHALGVMERQLATTPFLTGPDFSVADIALYAYTHVAAEGEFELTRFPHVQTWLQRIQGMPGYVDMDSCLQEETPTD